MIIRHSDILVVAWSNFEPGINVNGRKISNESLTIDVVNVGAGVDEALLAL